MGPTTTIRATAPRVMLGVAFGTLAFLGGLTTAELSAAPGSGGDDSAPEVGSCLSLERPELGASTTNSSLANRVEALEASLSCGVLGRSPVVTGTSGTGGEKGASSVDATLDDAPSTSENRADIDDLEKRVGDLEADVDEIRFARNKEYLMDRGRTQRAFWITWGGLTANGLAASLVGFSQYPVVVATTSSANAVLSLLPAAFTSFTFGVGSYTLSFVSIGVDIVAAAVPWATVFLWRAARQSQFFSGGSGGT